ncbi:MULTISPECIES: transposase [unclassified Streptomyces]|uniref:transposase n=1 Tax=unclassified Streptomyces TaxID=2593676 RepID=UPI000D13AD2E|nr:MULTISPECIES: transposase [unclassified Streptomyces]
MSLPDGQWIDAIAFKYRTGTPWMDLPERFGSWKCAHNRLRKWAADGTWEKVFTALLARDRAGRPPGGGRRRFPCHPVRETPQAQGALTRSGSHAGCRRGAHGLHRTPASRRPAPPAPSSSPRSTTRRPPVRPRARLFDR